MRRFRNVKIVATLGPASSDYETIRALHEAGADVFRLNMSHGDHEEIRERHAIIRQVEKDLNNPVGILADLQGPKLRVGSSPMRRRSWRTAQASVWIWMRPRVMQPVSACRTKRSLMRWKWAPPFWSTMARSA